MANKKQPYNWEKVQAGDIISFRYKSKKSKSPLMQTILVLNPSLMKRGQLKTSTQLVGIKLEESNKMQLELTKKQIMILEQIGEWKILDEENNLYKLDIKPQFITNDIKGVKPRAYDLLSKGLSIQGQYRTYDYYQAKKSSVYLEPIKVLMTKREMAGGTQKPSQPKKPKGGR